MDEICPPSTVYAAFNRYGGPKEIVEYPFNDHEGGAFFHEVVKMRWLAAWPADERSGDWPRRGRASPEPSGDLGHPVGDTGQPPRGGPTVQGDATDEKPGPLLETKLYLPKLRRGQVARPRLSERLSRGAERKLTLDLGTGWLRQDDAIGRVAGGHRGRCAVDGLALARPQR